MNQWSLCQYVPSNNVTMRCLGEGKRRGFWLPLSRYPSRPAARRGLTADGRTALARLPVSFSLSSSDFRRSLARFMIARRHHDHRLQMRWRRRRSWRTSGQSGKEGLNRLNPSSPGLARIQPTVQRTSKDRGSTRSFARSTTAAAVMAAANRPPRKVEPLRGRVNPR